jgi:two-component system sensor histidine kinase HydH
VAVAATLAVLGAVGTLAFHAAQRDRRALIATFGDEHLFRLRIAVREIESELAEVRQHLNFAVRLVDSAETGDDQRKQLEALLEVVRPYRAIAVYDSLGRQRVLALDPVTPAGRQTPWSEALARAARTAISRQEMAISEPLGDPSAPWDRAFATPLVHDGRVRGAVVILVDQKKSFERLRLVAPESSAKMLLLGPHGRPAPLTDPSLAAAADHGGRFGEVLDRMRAGNTGTTTLSVTDATALGMGTAEAVAVFTPIRTQDAGHWSVAVLDSTAALQSQEHAIFLRMVVLAATFALALGALSVYLIVSARRAIAVQERLRTAEQVAHLREKAEKILENVPVGVVTLDDVGRISGTNKAFRDRVPSAASGRTAEEALPDASPAALEALRVLLAQARSSRTVQRIIEPPLALTGRDSEFAVHAVPLDHPSPDLDLLLVIEDVTEIRALSSQLLRAEKLATVGVLAAGIAHEVGTPLGVVRGRAEMLAAKPGSPGTQSESARIIVEEIDRISRTIQELLDFSRVSRTATTNAVLLDDITAKVVELLAFEARTRKISVSVEIALTPPIAANPDQLKQVLVNVLLNALHACSAGGHVILRARPDAQRRCAVIEVVDDGAGIPDTLRHRVFDPFFTTKKRGKGTGLGLTVAAQIIRNHGGDIDLDSIVGKGTRVVVSWPFASRGAENLHERQEERTHFGGR